MFRRVFIPHLGVDDVALIGANAKTIGIDGGYARREARRRCALVNVGASI